MKKSVAVLAVSGFIMFGVSGCFQNPLENLVEDAVGGAVENAIEQELGGEDAEVDFSGDVSLPSDWPGEIPVPEGEIISAMTLDGSHTIVVNVASVAEGERVLQELLDSGFSVVFEQASEGMTFYGLENSSWTVQYQVIDDGEAVSVYMSVGPLMQ